MANLATATASDREAVRYVTETNKALMDELSKTNGELIIALKKVNAMSQIIANLRAKILDQTHLPTPLQGIPITISLAG